MTVLRKICLIGFDRIIGSFALGLKRSGFRGAIVGVDNPETIAKCWNLGIVTDGTDELSKALVGAELIVLSSHSGAQSGALARVLDLADDGAIISEMTRVKGDINRVFDESARPDVHYVGFRLLSESEADMDVENANRFFFEGKSVILTPRGKEDLEAYQVLSEVLKKMGAAVVAMSPQAHDRLLALHSQVPRVASLALLRRILESSGDLKLSPQMLTGWLVEELKALGTAQHRTWVDDVEANQELVVKGIDELVSQLQRIKASVISGGLKTEFDDLAAHADELLGLAVKTNPNELILVAGSDPKVLERVAEMFAKQRLTMGKLEKLENAEAGTYRIIMNSQDERDKATSMLRRAGIEVVDLSA
jgi:prephenate dehydrogenase